MCRKDGGRWGARGRDKRQREGLSECEESGEGSCVLTNATYGML
jgi:hypothetical protein